jgi:hypothetical protein
MLARVIGMLALAVSSTAAKSIWVDVTPETIDLVTHSIEIEYTASQDQYLFWVWTDAPAEDLAGAQLTTRISGETLSRAGLLPNYECGGTLWSFEIWEGSLRFSELRIGRDPWIYRIDLGALVQGSFLPLEGESSRECDDSPLQCGGPDDEVVADRRILRLGPTAKR